MAALLLAAWPWAAMAVEPDAVPPPKRTRLGLYLDAKEAYRAVLAPHSLVLFLDVRTRAEVAFLGMPTVADANVPYMELSDWYPWDEAKGTFRLEPNSDFVAEVDRRRAEKGLTKDDVVILMCRSGDRSARAADLLAEADYRKVYTVVDGFEGDAERAGPRQGQRVVNGWKNSDLPWSYKLDRKKMYRPDD